jgi:hypothetical protein
MINNKTKEQESLKNKEQQGEAIERQVQECLDKIDKAITGYHIAVRYLALKRIITDETSIMNKEYQWVDHWIQSPSQYDNMVI